LVQVSIVASVAAQAQSTPSLQELNKASAGSLRSTADNLGRDSSGSARSSPKQPSP